jgi:hypothetical protein
VVVKPGRKVINAFLALGFLAVAGHSLAVNKCTDPKTGQVVYSDTVCSQQAKNTKMEWAPRANTNTLGAYTAPGRRPAREPDRKLQGPPQAAQLLAVYQQWIDAERLANVTARIALAGPVAALQQLRRTSENLAVAACLSEAKAALLKLVSANTTSMLSFMEKQEIHSMLYQWVDRETFIREFEAAIENARC